MKCVHKEGCPKCVEGYQVKEVSSMKHDYIGMNARAAHELHEPWEGDGRTVKVIKTLPPKEKKLTIQHEIDENKLMRKGEHYPEAHASATRLERLGLHRKIGASRVGEKIRLKGSKRVSGR